jgi:glycosyltransferase involved in cell wall biosynthesis
MISSLTHQSLKNWKLLIYDNCSDDGTSQIIETFARSDQRIYIKHGENLVNAADNLQRALEYGIEHFQAAAIFILGGDDECGSEDFLELSLNYINSGVSLVIPSYKMIGSLDVETHISNQSRKLIGFSSKNWLNRLVHSIYPEHGNILYAVYESSLLESVVFSGRGRMSADSKRGNNLNFIADWWFIDTCLRNSTGQVFACNELVYVKFMKNIRYSNSYYFPERETFASVDSPKIKSKYVIYFENLVLFPILTLLYERHRIKVYEYPFMALQALFMVGSRLLSAIRNRLDLPK